MPPVLSMEEKNKKHCETLLKAYRAFHKKNGLDVTHVDGDGYCAFNCFCNILHLTDSQAKAMHESFQEWLKQEPFPAHDVVKYIDDITGRRVAMQGTVEGALNGYREDAKESEIEVHLVLLLAYMLDVPLALLAPVQDVYGGAMIIHGNKFNEQAFGFWFMDSQTPGRAPVYMTFEPYTGTMLNSMHFNLMYPGTHTHRTPMHALPFANLIRAGRKACQDIYAARLPPQLAVAPPLELALAPPPQLTLAPSPAPLLPVEEPEVVSCAPEPVAAPTPSAAPAPQPSAAPAPQPSAAAAPQPSAAAAAVKKRRAPRKHNPDAHKRYLANLSQEKRQKRADDSRERNRIYMARHREEKREAKLANSHATDAAEGSA